jgi:hypothetical protein
MKIVHLESLLQRRQARLDLLKQETSILEEQIRSISSTIHILANEDAQFIKFLKPPKVTMISDEVGTTGKKLSKKLKTVGKNKREKKIVKKNEEI